MSRILDELDKARAELLDLSLRNTLLNYRKLRSKGVEIVDEVPAQVFETLVVKDRAMTFLPAPEDLLGEGARRIEGDLLAEWFEQNAPTDEPEEGRGPAARHQDTKLQTPYAGPVLERRLLNTYYAARSTIEEQGVNTLYLALGMLRWFEASSSETERSAPLVLVPVTLDRTSARSRFRLRYTGDELGDNLSLQAKLHAEFRIDLPPLPETEDLDLEQYFAAVSSAIAEQDRWSVDPDAINLGFFWFSKLLMYEDLDPARWPSQATPGLNPVLGGLLGEEGFEDGGSPFAEDRSLDEQVDLGDLHQIRDADSSQTLAILDVLEGRNLVIQGPPGTGKSQTISNLIAEHVARGKKVLFVAEKMAALDVVKRRLDEDGVGDACLELHSHRTNKRSFLEELQRTLNLGKPQIPGGETVQDLVAHRDRLNAYADAIHRPIGPSSITPFQAYGQALAARQRLGDDSPPMIEDRQGWSGWTHDEFRDRIAVVTELEAVLQTTGVPADHPFWSSTRMALVPRDRDHLGHLYETIEEHLGSCRQSLRSLSERLHLAEPESLGDGRRLLAGAERAAQMPDLRGVAVGDPAWSSEIDQVNTVLEQGRRYRSLHDELDPQLLPEAWARDVLALRGALVQFGERWWRILAPEYRRAIRELRALSASKLPKAFEDRLSLVEGIRRSQQLEYAFEEDTPLLGRLFGERWRNGGSDWTALDEASTWLRRTHSDMATGNLPVDFLAVTEANALPEEIRRARSRAEAELVRLTELLDELEDLLVLGRETVWLRPEDDLDLAFDGLARQLEEWQKDPDALHDIVRYNHSDGALRNQGLSELADLAARWPDASEHLADLLTYEWHNSLIERALTERPELARFDGRSHEEAVRSFQDLDRQRVLANRARVAYAHWEQLPARNGSGQLGVLRHEMEKRRRHKAIRRLMEEAGDAILRIKPVFMMSPLSVASYLSPGSLTFDLVIFDEASQVRPVDAFGAILRARQAVVVGDSKQLPPTPFFEKLVDDADEDESRSFTGDLESILGLFASKGVPDRMLRWHYRSRHDSLIAVSNHELYDNKLFVFPSPDHAREELGVVLRHHPETVYEPGTKRYNVGEAEIVADAVMEHARAHPGRSLGVAAFSQSQAQQIQDQVELRRRQHPEVEGFFNAHPDEPFFAKNLENVQGDERDIIFISVGYGRQESGTLWMRFGPLNQDGGERRLNVLTTRARYRCQVFSNFKADEIRLDGTDARGVAALKRYLQYAETGQLDLPSPSERAPDSALEEHVCAAVASLGYEVHPQVGSGGFFIDLGVVDPERPGRYLLGIECDGRSYHSASWARDRDRLRQKVLEGLGWSLHRVWSTDWFHNPDRELRKIAESLERTRARGRRPSSEGQRSEAHNEPDEAEPEERSPVEPFQRDASAGDRHTLCAEPYRCADVSTLPHELRGQELHSVPPGRLAPWVIAVVTFESPVHESEVIRRLVDAAGYQRAGARLQGSVLKAVAHAVRRNKIERRGQFLWAPDGAVLSFRGRSDQHQNLRQMDRIAPEEIGAAILAVVEASAGIAKDEAVVEVARLFGFSRTTKSIRRPIEQSLASLVEEGVLGRSGGDLKLCPVDA